MKDKIEKKLLLGFSAFAGSFAGLILISFAMILVASLGIAALL